MKGLGWKDRWFQAFDNARRAFTGEVVWSNVVYLNGCRVSFQLKRKHDRSWIDLTFEYRASTYHPTETATYTKMDMDDLQKIEAALLVTKSLLDSPEMDELARKQEAELEHLKFAARLWRRLTDRYLWEEVVPIRWGSIYFRIKRDKHAYIDIEIGEGRTDLPVQLSDLEALEEGLLAAMAPFQPTYSGPWGYRRAGKRVTD